MGTAPRYSPVLLILALSVAMTCLGCGGLPSSTPHPTTKTLTSIVVTPASAALQVGATQQFAAAAKYNDGSTADVSTAASWQTASQLEAKVSSSGLVTGVASGATSVTASLSGMSGTATLTVAMISVAVTPTAVSIAAGATAQFTASVQNTGNTAVIWSVDGVTGGNSTVGTISSAGVYSGPSLGGNHTVTVTSAADLTKTASAAVTVTSLVSVSPGVALVAAGATQQFTATVGGLSNTSVTWSVDGIAGGNITVGTISSTGLYTAPAQAGMHTVTATSVANNTETATAAISVGTASVSPGSALVNGGATEQFSATVQGFTNTAVTWSVDGVSGGNSAVGTITAAGVYTAPSEAGSHTIMVTSVADSSLAASAAVSVLVLTISPTAVTVAPSGTEQFTSTIQGTTTTTVSWSVDGVAGGNSTVGTISAAGLYSAPFAIGGHTITATSALSSSISTSTTLTVTNTSAGAVLTYHNDDTRDGAFTQETTLTTANVNSTQFGKLFSYRVDGQIYAQPLYLPRVSIAGVTKSVVYVATQNNTVYAFDASGAQTTPFWQVNLGTSVTKDDVTGVNPVVGILATPVIDATTNTMYVLAEVFGKGIPFFLHALDVTTGLEKFGGPVQVNGSVSGTEGGASNHTITLGADCYQRMGLALNPVTNAISIPFGSCTHGWVLAYDKTTLQQTAIFNDTPDDNGGGGLWASGGAPAVDDATGDMYLMSGVDVGDEISTGYNDSFLRLNAADLSVLDYFTPDNNLTLEQNDADLGSGSNILLPSSSAYPHETIGGGKDGNLFVVNRDHMGSFDSTNSVIQTVHTGTQQYNNIFSTPVYWNGSIYVHCNQDVLRAYSWSASTGLMSMQPTSSAAAVYSMHGATASVSANGTANGIIWDTDNSNYNENDPSLSGPLVLHAYDATNVATELYNSSQAGTRDTSGLALKFTVPSIAGGRVFVPTASELDVYGLLP